jgi:hypothetical protein
MQFTYDEWRTVKKGLGAQIMERAIGAENFRETFASTKDIADGANIFRIITRYKSGAEQHVKRATEEMLVHCAKFGSV